MQKIYSYTRSIPFQDIDAAGIVFFAHLFRYAHEAYEQFMEEAGESLVAVVSGGEYLLPVVHTEADYKYPLHHGEKIRIELGLKRLGNSSFTLHYSCRDEFGVVRAEVETVHVTLDSTTRRPMRVPEQLRVALSRSELHNAV